MNIQKVGGVTVATRLDGIGRGIPFVYFPSRTFLFSLGECDIDVSRC